MKRTPVKDGSPIANATEAAVAAARQAINGFGFEAFAVAVAIYDAREEACLTQSQITGPAGMAGAIKASIDGAVQDMNG